LDHLQGEAEKSTPGLDKRISTPGLPGLEALNKCLQLLGRAYSYDLRPQDRRK
jgi:hypothetical protein